MNLGTVILTAKNLGANAYSVRLGKKQNSMSIKDQGLARKECFFCFFIEGIAIAVFEVVAEFKSIRVSLNYWEAVRKVHLGEDKLDYHLNKVHFLQINIRINMEALEKHSSFIQM